MEVDRQPGPGIGGEVVIAGVVRLFEMRARQRQIEHQWPAWIAGTRDHRARALDAVVVRRLIFEAKRAALRALRRLHQLDRWREIGNNADGPGAEPASVLLDRKPAPLRERRA